MTDTKIKIGGNPINADLDAYENHVIVLDYVEGLARSDANLLLGGTPIALYELGDGKKAVGVYKPTVLGLTNNGKKTIYKGYKLAICGRPEGGFILKTSTDPAALGIGSYATMWLGNQIGLNDNRSMLAQQFFDSIVEERTISVGGMPLVCGRNSNDWFLAIN